MYEYIPWFFTGLSLFGAFINARGYLLASSITWLIANCFWLYLDLTNGLGAQAALYTCFIGTNILGIYTGFRKRAQDDIKQACGEN